MTDKTQAALKLALDYLEPLARQWGIESKAQGVCIAIRLALADHIRDATKMIEPAQQQEPVAWDNCRSENQCRSWCGNSACASHWNDTSPPASKPLTDEEIDALWLQHDFIRAPDRKRQAFARAIEAAHGITGEQK